MTTPTQSGFWKVRVPLKTEDSYSSDCLVSFLPASRLLSRSNPEISCEDRATRAFAGLVSFISLLDAALICATASYVLQDATKAADFTHIRYEREHHCRNREAPVT